MGRYHRFLFGFDQWRRMLTCFRFLLFRSESLVSIPKYHVGAPGLDNFGVHKNRVSLSRTHLPSCLFYTFANTRGCAINCMSMSPDASIAVAGFQESSVRVWDYKVSTTPSLSISALFHAIFSICLRLNHWKLPERNYLPLHTIPILHAAQGNLCMLLRATSAYSAFQTLCKIDLLPPSFSWYKNRVEP